MPRQTLAILPPRVRHARCNALPQDRHERSNQALWSLPEPPPTPTTTRSAGPAAPARRRRRWPWTPRAPSSWPPPRPPWCAGGIGPGSARVTYETVKVDRGRIVVQVTASGTVSALKTVQVGSQVSGRVAELHADFNDPVKKGQLLARLDTQLFKSAVEQARASARRRPQQRRQGPGAAARGRAPAGPAQALGDGKFLAQEVVDSRLAAAEVARAALAGARAQAQQAAASLRQAELNLAMTAIYSPIDGVVISRSVDVGQTVAASLQAPTIFTLAEDLRKMQVEAHVAEGDVGQADRRACRSPSPSTRSPGSKFAGKLRQVRNAAATVQNVVTYDAIVDVDNPELKLRPGMTANVTFVVAERDDVVRIPNAALRFRPPAARGRAAPGPPARDRAPGRRADGAAGGADRKVVFTLDAQDQRRTRARAGRRHRRQLHRAGRGRRAGRDRRWSRDLDDGAQTAGRARRRQPPGGAPAPGMGVPGHGRPAGGATERRARRRRRPAIDRAQHERRIIELRERQQDLPAGRNRRCTRCAA